MSKGVDQETTRENLKEVQIEQGMMQTNDIEL